MNMQRSPERAPDDEEDVVDAPDDEAEEEARRQAERERAQAAAQDDDDDGQPGDGDDEEKELEPGETQEEADERRARAMGWVPLEEWRGDKRRWAPASEFLDRAYANRPVFEERLDRITNDLASSREEQKASRQQIADLQTKLSETTEVLVELNERSRTAFDRGYAKAKKDLLARRKQAREDGDVEAFAEATERLEELEQERSGQREGDDERRPPARKGKDGKDGKDGEERRRQDDDDTPPRVDPALTAWKDKNAWFDTDDELAGVAQSIEKRIMREHPTLPLAQRLEQISREIRQRYPEKFRNSRRDAPSPVNNGERRGGNGGGRKGRTVADLPADAKAALAKFKATIPGYTDKEFLRDYEWTE